MQLKHMTTCDNRGFEQKYAISGPNECAYQSTESPIFDAAFWSENGVSCPQCGHERNKIWDSVLWCIREYSNIGVVPHISFKYFEICHLENI